jgi:hypothetical protein
MNTRLLSMLLDKLTPEQRLYIRQRVTRLRHPVWFGSLRRTTPVSDRHGFDRGHPVDRYYIDRFLSGHREDIRGRVLEVKDNGYTRRFGMGVEREDVLDIDPGNPRATIVADLSAVASTGIGAGGYDCFVLTQTLQYIYDIRGAIAGAHGLLRAGGVLLATVPALSHVASRHEQVIDYWRFTPASAAALFGEVFGPAQVQVRSYGNVLTAIAFLAGLATEELSRRELEVNDPDMPVLVTIRAVKR